MVAEQIRIPSVPSAVHKTIFVLFDNERNAETLVLRLGELSIPASAITFLRVAVNERRLFPTRRDLRQSPFFARYALIGAASGCALAVLIGILLNFSNFLALSFLETIFIYFVALSLLGAVLGGALGAIVASYRAPDLTAQLLPVSGNGFLIIIKTPVHLARDCELAARSLGATRISP